MFGSHVGELAALGTATLWTLSSLTVTAAGKHVGSVAISFLRMAIACALMMVYGQLVAGSCLPTGADLQTWLLLGISGILGFFFCDACLMKAMLLIGPRLVLLIYSLTPPLTALASLCIDDVLTLRDWAAMGATLAGVAWVVLERPNRDNPTHSPHNRRWGIALALFATTTSALGMVISREVMGYYDQPVAATLIRALASLPGYIVLITLWRRWPDIIAAARHRQAMAPLALGAAMGPFLGNVLIMVALTSTPAGVVTTITATMPVLILPFSVLFYREKISLRAVGGAFVAVAGVALLMLP
ncbi:MAG: DMT family transporter [Planctomycetes bacterium]|nr:DMT family transporter [Planctomycetota bacterium]MBU4399541.1 DMT family transporter [Planctomycetota bacterium]MCG2684576.1 DMT family transporter [Planctomycetales bacterium]